MDSTKNSMEVIRDKQHLQSMLTDALEHMRTSRDAAGFTANTNMTKAQLLHCFAPPKAEFLSSGPFNRGPYTLAVWNDLHTAVAIHKEYMERKSSAKNGYHLLLEEIDTVRNNTAKFVQTADIYYGVNINRIQNLLESIQDVLFRFSSVHDNLGVTLDLLHSRLFHEDQQSREKFQGYILQEIFASYSRVLAARETYTKVGTFVINRPDPLHSDCIMLAKIILDIIENKGSVVYWLDWPPSWLGISKSGDLYHPEFVEMFREQIRHPLAAEYCQWTANLEDNVAGRQEAAAKLNSIYVILNTGFDGEGSTFTFGDSDDLGARLYTDSYITAHNAYIEKFKDFLVDDEPSQLLKAPEGLAFAVDQYSRLRYFPSIAEPLKEAIGSWLSPSPSS